MTKKELYLLHYFVVNKNRVLTKQNIAEHLWGDYVETGNSLDFVYQYIKNIRKKITKAGGGVYMAEKKRSSSHIYLYLSYKSKEET